MVLLAGHALINHTLVLVVLAHAPWLAGDDVNLEIVAITFYFL